MTRGVVRTDNDSNPEPPAVYGSVTPGQEHRAGVAGSIMAKYGATAGALFLGYVLIALTGWPSPEAVRVLTDVMFSAGSLVYVSLAALAVRSTRGPTRTAWTLIAIAFVFWAVAEALWAYYTYVDGRVPYPSWADLFYVLYMPLVSAGMLFFPSVRTWRDRSRLILDGTVVTGALFLIAWLTVMRSIWTQRGGSHLEFALSMAYPAGDVLSLAVGVMVLLRAPAGLRLPLSLLVAGLAFAAMGNGVWSYVGEPQAYRVGGLADILYFANILLVVLALIAAQRADPGETTTDAAPERLSVWLPLLPLLIAGVFVAAAGRESVVEAPVIVIGVVLVSAALARQVVQGDELVARQRRIGLLTDRLNEEIDSAGRYVASILPDDLRAPVSARSRYLPSRAVGGDCFGFTWIDSDHFSVYLIDVSGHGVRPALLAVSVHNLLRSGSLGTTTLLSPDLLLIELNSRFSKNSQGGHYFTMWYGVYRSSTAELRYANAGHPPPLLFDGSGDAEVLAGEGGLPVGMVADGGYPAHCRAVARGSQILLYSDGVIGDFPRMADFVERCAGLARKSPDWLDDLVGALPVADDDSYLDDCSLVLLDFPLDTSSGRRSVC